MPVYTGPRGSQSSARTSGDAHVIGREHVTLEFDRGTVLLSSNVHCERSALASLPQVLWDPRVRSFRAPAYVYWELLDALTQRELGYRDLVCSQTLRRSVSPDPARAPRSPLRPYQWAALASFQAAGSRGLVVMPTGAGKTRLATELIGQHGSALCLVPTRALLRQWCTVLDGAGLGPVGVVGDGSRVVRPITVATFESALRHMAEFGAKFELLVVDEVHHFGHGRRDEALEMCAARYRLGLTATPPDAESNAHLQRLLGPPVFDVSLAELRGTFLADFEVRVVRLPLSADEDHAYRIDHAVFSSAFRSFQRSVPGSDFRRFVAAAQLTDEGRRAVAAYYRMRDLLAMTEAKHRMVGELLERHPNSRALIFTETNPAAYRLAVDYLVAPITCDIGRDERGRVLEAFAQGRLRALVSSRVLNEGLDVPDADVGIIVGTSTTERDHIQRIGRLLRPSPGKRAVIYELVSAVASEERRHSARHRSFVRAGLSPKTPPARPDPTHRASRQTREDV